MIAQKIFSPKLGRKVSHDLVKAATEMFLQDSQPLEALSPHLYLGSIMSVFADLAWLEAPGRGPSKPFILRRYRLFSVTTLVFPGVVLHALSSRELVTY